MPKKCQNNYKKEKQSPLACTIIHACNVRWYYTMLLHKLSRVQLSCQSPRLIELNEEALSDHNLPQHKYGGNFYNPKWFTMRQLNKRHTMLCCGDMCWACALVLDYCWEANQKCPSTVASFYNVPRTSGAGRDAAPSPSPRRSQPRWSQCGSSHVAWRALVSPSRSLYWHRGKDYYWPCLFLNNACRFVFHNVCKQYCGLL